MAGLSAQFRKVWTGHSGIGGANYQRLSPWLGLPALQITNACPKHINLCAVLMGIKIYVNEYFHPIIIFIHPTTSTEKFKRIPKVQLGACQLVGAPYTTPNGALTYTQGFQTHPLRKPHSLRGRLLKNGRPKGRPCRPVGGAAGERRPAWASPHPTVLVSDRRHANRIKNGLSFRPQSLDHRKEQWYRYCISGLTLWFTRMRRAEPGWIE